MALQSLILLIAVSLPVAAPAQYTIGERALARGDYVEAWLILKPLAEAGHARAQHDVGFMYAMGLGVPESMAQAARWLTLAAEQGNAVSQARLGWMYYNGLGVAQDRVLAYRHSRAAADAGDPWGQCNVGYSYLEGDGVERDLEAAARWFRLSAEQGFALCQRNIGMMYERGEGLAADPVLAYAWYGVAAVAGDTQAVALRDKLGARLAPEDLERARAKARELYRSFNE